jgi:hypothetical protein
MAFQRLRQLARQFLHHLIGQQHLLELRPLNHRLQRRIHFRPVVSAAGREKLHHVRIHIEYDPDLAVHYDQLIGLNRPMRSRQDMAARFQDKLRFNARRFISLDHLWRHIQSVLFRLVCWLAHRGLDAALPLGERG